MNTPRHARTVAQRAAIGCAAVIGLAVACGAALAQTSPTANQVIVSGLQQTHRIVVKYHDGRAFALSALAPTAQRDSIKAMSARAGANLSALRQTAGGATVFDMGRKMSLAEARLVAARIALDPAVAYAEPDVRVNALQSVSTPNDPGVGYQWPLTSAVGGSTFLAAWSHLPAQAPRITVAVLDTGTLPHPDLVGNDLGGYDFVSDTSIAGDGDARDADPTDPGDYCTTQSPTSNSSWHGLAAASLIAATANNGQGIAGAAGNHANILSVRVLGRCGGWLSDTADAITWASGGAVPGVPINGSPARVISMSLGAVTPACPQYMQDAVNGARARNVVMVAASGNESSTTMDAPASCAGVVSVGAHTASGDLATYSNRNTAMTLTAPGGGGCATHGS